MDTIEYLRGRIVELTNRLAESEARSHQIRGGIAEMEYALQQFQAAEAAPESSGDALALGDDEDAAQLREKEAVTRALMDCAQE